jgi:flagellar hook-length control protein FliK
MVSPKLIDLGKANPSALRLAPRRRSPDAANAAPEAPADKAIGGFEAALAAHQKMNSPPLPKSESAKTKEHKSKDDSPLEFADQSPVGDKPQDSSPDAQPVAHSPPDVADASQDASQDQPSDSSSHATSSNAPEVPAAPQSQVVATLPPPPPAAPAAPIADDSTSSTETDTPVQSNSTPSSPSAGPTQSTSPPAPRAPSDRNTTSPSAIPPEQAETNPQSQDRPQSATLKAAQAVEASPDSQAAADAPKSSDSSDQAPTPPNLADQDGKQAHDKTRRAAHVQSLDSGTSSVESAPQPGPALAALAAALEAAPADPAAVTETPSLPLKPDTSSTPAVSATPPNLLAGASAVAPAQTNADLAPAAQETPPAAPADTMDQIVFGLKAKLDARTGKAEILLNPPNLGAMKVSISLDNGTLIADFQSASSLVRDLLKGNLEKLKTVLQDQGVAVDRLSVQAPPDTAGSGQNPQASFGSATHDGRSAGQYQQNPRSPQQRSAGDGFARVFTQAQEAPLDLVA